MADTKGSGGTHGERYTDESGEAREMERGIDSLGTPAAGAGVTPHAVSHGPLPAGAGHQHLQDTTHPAFHYSSDAGELRDLEQGVQLSEEGEKETTGGGGGNSEVF